MCRNSSNYYYYLFILKKANVVFYIMLFLTKSLSLNLQNVCVANLAGTAHQMKLCAAVGLSAHTSGLFLLHKCTFKSDVQLCFGQVG